MTGGGRAAWSIRAGIRAGSLLLLVGLSACDVGRTPPPDTLVVVQGAEPKSLDPHVATSANDFRILANVFEGLVRFVPGTLEIGPGLAREWDISGDGTTYTFHLREGIRFHDGSPLDAQAVADSFLRMLDPEHPDHHTGPFPLAFFFAPVVAVEAVDRLTVRFQLEAPFAPFLANLAYPTGYVVSPQAVRERGKGFGRLPSGTGPFEVVEWQSQRLVKLRRYPHFRGSPPPLEQVYFRPVSDENARLTELLSGGADLVMEVPPDMIQYFRDAPEFQVVETVGPHLWFVILNMREGPFTDPRVRRAANYAIDKEGLTRDLLQSTATVANGPIPKAFGASHDPDLKPYPYDPERARELIKAAGAEGERVVLMATEGGAGMLDPAAMAASIQADLQAVGLEVVIESYEWNSFLGRVNQGLAGQADMAIMAWITNDPDTLPYLTLRRGAWPEDGGFNSGYYENPEVDRLLEAARRETDPAERAKLYHRIQRLVHEDAPWLFVASWRQNAVASREVKNFHLEPSFLFHLDAVSVDRDRP